MAGDSDFTVASIPLNIVQRAAPLLIGVMLNYFLLGMLTVQLYTYWCFFPDDKLLLKLLVYSVYVLELLQVCCATADLSYWFGSGFGDVSHLNDVYVSAFDGPILGSVIALIIQLFFCYRVWKLRLSDWAIIASAVIAAFSVIQAVGGIGSGVMAHQAKHFSVAARIHSARTLLSIRYIGEAAADVLIAMAMAYLLLRSRKELPLESRSMVHRIVRFIVQSNSATAGTAIISLALFVATPGKYYFLASGMTLSKLYSNTLLGSLNYRLCLRGNDASIPGKESNVTLDC